MPDPTVVAHVELLTAAGSAPAIATADVETILGLYKIADGEGRAPSDDGWQETYDLYGACAEVCRIKAATVAAEFDFTAEGSSFSRSQQHAQLMEQAARFDRRRVAANGGSILVDTFGVKDKKAGIDTYRIVP